MGKKFRDLTAATMSKESLARAESKARVGLTALRLQALRRTREMSQEELAAELTMEQGNVSRLERQSDMHISTLRRYVEALGGTLEIVAHFADGYVKLSQFDDQTGSVVR